MSKNNTNPKYLTKSKNSFFENLIVKQQFLNRPNATFEWDELLAEKETRKKIKRDPNHREFFAYIESRFAYDHAKLFDVKLREEHPSAKEHLKVRETLQYFIRESISKHASQDVQIHAFRRWIDTAIRLRQRHNYEGYFLVRDTLMEIDKEYQLTKDKAFRPYLKRYNQLVHVDATLIDEQLRADYSKIPLSDFANPEGFSKKPKASVNLKTFLAGRDYLEDELKRNIMEAQGNARIKAFCRWIDIAVELRNKHNYEGYVLVITNLSLIDQITTNKDFPKSYVQTYAQLLNHADPSINFLKLRELWTKDKSPNKLKATFYWSKELTNLNEKIEIACNPGAQLSMRQEKNRKLAEIDREQRSFRDRAMTYSTNIPDHLEVQFAMMQEEYNDGPKEQAASQSNTPVV
ncbi:RasGEF domain protein [Legionella steelei]|uniref:RasGEF domain protein n=1 Tax=Legionella steelei TaxID=947033 RepID=A0A0W0ZIX5_9GAMM|nr:RasGEF domain-containing protein [Legionella steelei]KTD69231.1 RasGEF domain protein [Legionella steelei]